MGISVLIVCTGNTCRSQMAEGFLKSFAPALKVWSAGTRPAFEVHPMAVRVMRESGIDISGLHPKSINQFLDQAFDYVVTVCDAAREDCPIFTGEVRHRLHFSFDDPAMVIGSDEEQLAVFRRVRDEIAARFRVFADDIGRKA
ncbi:MAG: arsenate reductase ArsC [Chlorobiaceae bacterium]|nr:arsenate reductase ArsC [Chlorobiaceae bacterium]